MTKMSSPLVKSPPLPTDWSHVGVPVEPILRDEAKRAALELVWALHRQRAAWAKFARVKASLDDRNITYVDNERAYTLASSDVKWWRAEVSSRANALSALLAAVAHFYPEEG